MEKDFRAADVAQKFMAKALPCRSAFDQSRNISQHKVIQRTKVWFQCSKGIVADFGVSVGQNIQKAGFAGIRHTQQTYIRKYFEFQTQFTALTFLAVAVVGDRVVGSCVGDSRLYRLTLDGGIEIVTEVASKHRLGSGQVEPWPIHLPLIPGEVLLLASDGAWTPLGLPTLRRVWAGASTLHFSEFPALLLDEGGKKGCADDMTVIAMKLG